MSSWWNKSDYQKFDQKASWSTDDKDKNHPWSNNDKFKHSNDSRKSSWKSWHQGDSEAEELRSPQGKRKQELCLPPDFKPDAQCVDSRELYGRKFFKQVQLTNWSQKHGLAGREISDLKLHELAYGGWNNFYLRHLSTEAFTTIVFCRKINESILAKGLLSSIRDSKRRWDIDSVARECAKRHPDCIPVSASASSKGEETSREMQTLINFLIKQLEPLANEDRDEHIRLLEAKLAEKEKPASSSALPVVESPSMAQPAKRRRIAIKSDLTKHLFDMSIGVTERPLAFEAPSSHTAADVKKWWSSLKVKNMEGLQPVQSRADTILVGLSLEERTGLRDRACSLGLPVSVAMKLKDLECLRVVLSALYMLDY